MEFEPGAPQRPVTKVKPLAAIDPATGLLNPHGWLAFAKRHLKRAVHSHQRLGLIFIRIQHLARRQDELGSPASHVAIQQVTESLQLLIRPGDLLGRWREEDFIVLLPYIDGASVEQIAERLAQGLRKKLVESDLSSLTVVTGGASLVVTRGELQELDHLLAESERRLVAAAAR